MKNIAIFASGSGTNFQSIVDSVKNGLLNANIRLLVCDNPNAFVLERAKNEKIPIFVFSSKDYTSKAEYEKDILHQLQKQEVEFIVLAGYMRLIGKTLLKPFEGKIVNIHPSLLPLFPGKNAVEQALEAGVSETGVTIHYVDEGMDTGPIIEQRVIPIAKSDTKPMVLDKIKRVEHELYPNVLRKLLNNHQEENHAKKTCNH